MNPSSLKFPSRRLRLWRAGRRTGKIFLLGVLVCAGQMYGMENLYEKNSYKSLPSELKQQIINNALAASDNFDEAVSMIKKFSILHGVKFDKLFNNLEDFTKLVHMLSDKFGERYPCLTDIDESDDDVMFYRPYEMAKEFKSLIAGKYTQLIEQLSNSVKKGDKNIEKTKNLIQRGADVNGLAMICITLAHFRQGSIIETVKLLLDNGANPYLQGSLGTPLKQLSYLPLRHDVKKQIQALLKKAMRKYPPSYSWRSMEWKDRNWEER